MTHLWLFVLFSLAVLVPLTDFATVVVPSDDMKIKHTWHDIPVNWETLGHPPAGSTIDLHIVLQPDQESAVVEAVSEISNPKHSRYRAFLSREQVNELIRPSPESVELVCAWLKHNSASKLLGASYQLYRNMNTNETTIRTVGYSLPEVPHTHVQTVMPTTHFFSMEVTVQTPHKRTFGPVPAQIQAALGKLGTVQARQPPPEPPPEPPIVEPENLRWLYGTVEYNPAAYGPGQNSLAVVGNRLPSQQDLTEFMNKYQKEDANGATFNIQNVDGLLNLGELPDETSNVAVQYATAMAYPTPLFVFRIIRTDAAFLQFIHFLLGMQPVPRTVGISFSYFLEHHLPPSEAFYMCGLFLRFAARGASVLVASGNDGVGAGNCRTFNVEFPSSCPWVTSVGGTQNLHPEVGTPSSGGGFSRLFQRPPYQELEVSRYLPGIAKEYDGRYRPWGRGYPDISAQAFGCRIYLNGVLDVASGTACAVSTAAGIISLLNDYMISTRQANELPDRAPLGFLNDWLYSDEVLSEKGLNDIIAGSNPGCGTEGFDAKPGWDPVTGLGTLNFQKLLYILKRKRFLGLPPAPVPTPRLTPS